MSCMLKRVAFIISIAIKWIILQNCMYRNTNSIKSSVLYILTMYAIEEILDHLNLPWFERIITNHNGNVFEAVLMACP